MIRTKNLKRNVERTVSLVLTVRRMFSLLDYPGILPRETGSVKRKIHNFFSPYNVFSYRVTYSLAHNGPRPVFQRGQDLYPDAMLPGKLYGPVVEHLGSLPG